VKTSDVVHTIRLRVAVLAPSEHYFRTEESGFLKPTLFVRNQFLRRSERSDAGDDHPLTGLTPSRDYFQTEKYRFLETHLFVRNYFLRMSKRSDAADDHPLTGLTPSRDYFHTGKISVSVKPTRS
jgi:hypothetical protein